MILNSMGHYIFEQFSVFQEKRQKKSKLIMKVEF